LAQEVPEFAYVLNWIKAIYASVAISHMALKLAAMQGFSSIRISRSRA